jgi:D-threo-aldose 1-dehydrogenase
MNEGSNLAIAPVGHTSLKVTRLGFGTAPIGNLYTEITPAQAHAAIQVALEREIAFFDTAPYYGLGESERRLGEALADVPRERYVLQTKVGRTLVRQADAAIPSSDWTQGTVFDYSRDAILRGLEGSLQRLRVDAVDCVLIHDPDEHFREALEQAYPTLADLRAEGMVKAIGVGMNQWQMLAEFARHADFDCFLLAGRYTLLEQGALGFLNECHTRGLGLFLGGVFNSGILARGATLGAKYNYSDAPPEILERARKLENVCLRYEVPVKSAALQFAAAHPAVTSLILGMETVAEVIENLHLWHTPIPEALWEEMKAEGLLVHDAPCPG